MTELLSAEAARQLMPVPAGEKLLTRIADEIRAAAVAGKGATSVVLGDETEQTAYRLGVKDKLIGAGFRLHATKSPGKMGFENQNPLSVEVAW